MSSVFVVYEVDFGHMTAISIVDAYHKAYEIQLEKESENTKDWIKYIIQEWDVK